ncbi:AraC family transcriptional regulator [Amphibacillus xylanus]|uniref:Putative AraC family transcriptional regulator n=1 Tax=Amphibacillus xylanus (strain ATCC 51415 / DSM 6626 / JCM 7361 / LMG 17667 / NBRC 15112 / Ep01) TaxID=698758 RepID=K0J802_AMPXN|nr:AraC family transcriptional regulator [Amphibacillus xylanus]BAM48263.1 putative AraC family transcriptional regulator [Amphibacillus xylanus NBRC 15112]
MEKLHLSKEEHTSIPDPAFPINIFFIRHPEQSTIPLHWHNHLEWLYITKGSFRIQVSAEFKDVSAGDIIFVNRKQLHSAFPKSHESQLYAIVFNQAFLIDGEIDRVKQNYLIPLLNNEFNIPFYYQSNHQQLDSLQACLEKIIYSFTEKRFGYEILVKAHLLEAIAQIFQFAHVAQTFDHQSNKYDVIKPVLFHISNHFDQPLSVKQAADMCNLSPNYFCYVFKKATGYSLKTYINLLRISEAEHLLYSNQYTIQEIAYLVGFSDSTYFGRTFKRFKQKTPTEARELYLESKSKKHQK